MKTSNYKKNKTIKHAIIFITLIMNICFHSAIFADEDGEIVIIICDPDLECITPVDDGGSSGSSTPRFGGGGGGDYTDPGNGGNEPQPPQVDEECRLLLDAQRSICKATADNEFGRSSFLKCSILSLLPWTNTYDACVDSYRIIRDSAYNLCDANYSVDVATQCL